MGYRPKTNSYDAWDLKQWEQYYRDLAVFGSNAVELVPPRTDDAADSPHFPLPPLEMMTGMSKLADAYGLDVWIWYPAMDRDYSDENTVEYALQKWAYVFQQLPRIDAVFVPGGDPGHTQPKYLMALLERQAEILHRTHPHAKMWVSPQSFNESWLAEFIEILRRDEPAWLAGVVFGPQVRVSLPTLRDLVPERYPIRHYPDITHSRQCQYPVPDWDYAYAVTEARECINPRPVDEATIFRLLQPYTVGFLTYSEGCNDDVNKFIWSGLGWNPDTPVVDILRDYAGYFIGEAYRDDFAQGLLALERNWRGPLLTNAGVDTTLGQFREMERHASPALLANWRFQQALYRAYYDAYIRQRLVHEKEAEERAIEQLHSAKPGQAEAAMSRTPNRCSTRRHAHKCRRGPAAACLELADDLYKSIRMQQASNCIRRSPSTAAPRWIRSITRSTIGPGSNIISWPFASSRTKSSDCMPWPSWSIGPIPGRADSTTIWATRHANPTWSSAQAIRAIRRRWLRPASALQGPRRVAGRGQSHRPLATPVGSIMPNRCWTIA